MTIEDGSDVIFLILGADENKNIPELPRELKNTVAEMISMEMAHENIKRLIGANHRYRSAVPVKKQGGGWRFNQEAAVTEIERPSFYHLPIGRYIDLSDPELYNSAMVPYALYTKV